ncbi:hypothetical protein NPIL_94231 [Nephila pilipes]|uniref:Uncharacterized protein n=1 Tax=Nephila pilipes TaxID=299642 RepID=A0A8X6Q074_NEPPI|nr:hypothetical protein NPIL_94231 [Nephila pilipes]
MMDLQFYLKEVSNIRIKKFGKRRAILLNVSWLCYWLGDEHLRNCIWLPMRDEKMCTVRVNGIAVSQMNFAIFSELSCSSDPIFNYSGGSGQWMLMCSEWGVEDLDSS